jgi:hypothetical protein
MPLDYVDNIAGLLPPPRSRAMTAHHQAPTSGQDLSHRTVLLVWLWRLAARHSLEIPGRIEQVKRPHPRPRPMMSN